MKQRGGDKLHVYTWVGMANTKGLQDNKHNSSLNNPTRGVVGSISIF